MFHALTCNVKKDKLETRAKRCIFIGYIEGVKGYKLWRLEPREVKFFISKDVTFGETQIVIMCRNPEKGKETVHVEVEPFDDGSNHLEVSEDEASNNVNQPCTSYSKGPCVHKFTLAINLCVTGRG